MNPLKILSGPIALIDRDNVDTDAIIPATRTQEITTRLGSGLFGNWRYEADGSPKPDFVLNKAPWDTSVALVSGANFGCGSSREQAPWALKDFGIRAVFAASFGDIFAANCLKNGMLALTLPEEALSVLRAAATDPENCRVEVDLSRDQITVGVHSIPLALPTPLRDKLMSGKDDIELLLDIAKSIDLFQHADHEARPWVWNV